MEQLNLAFSRVSSALVLRILGGKWGFSCIGGFLGIWNNLPPFLLVLINDPCRRRRNWFPVYSPFIKPLWILKKTRSICLSRYLSPVTWRPFHYPYLRESGVHMSFRKVSPLKEKSLFQVCVSSLTPTWCLAQGSAHFFVKQVVNIFGFVGRWVSVAIAELWPCSIEAAVDHP